MSHSVTSLLILAGVIALGGCASQSVGPAAALNDSQRAECATLRAQNVDMNQTAVMPDFCKNAGGMSWSSEPAGPIKLDLGKDKQGDR